MQDRINMAFEMFDSEASPDEIRSVCKAIGSQLAKQFGEKIDAWEKSQLASAIGALNWNLSLAHPVSETGLRLALFSLNKALVPVEYRSPDYPVKDHHLKDLTFQDFVDAFEEM